MQTHPHFRQPAKKKKKWKTDIMCIRSKPPVQFLATKSSLKNVRNAFYFTLKYFFLRKIFKFFS